MDATVPAPAHYDAPDAVTRRVLNPVIALLGRLGISVLGTRVLEVRGRRSGEWRTTPVNLHAVDGVEYLVAARGETQWVRNLRAAGGGCLRLGRRRRPVAAQEVRDEDKVEILRTYLERWGWEVGRYFGEITAASTDEEIRWAAHRHPVFVVSPEQA